MFDWLKGRPDDRRKASDIYGAVVTQARQPALYTLFGVPDSIVGRYEMVAMHLALVLERLGAEGTTDEELRRTLVEAFVTNMDDSMRELGFGDAAVPKNVKKAAAGLYARAVDYRTALLEPNDAALSGAIGKHLYEGATGEAETQSASKLAAYARRIAADLARQETDALRGGRVTFPAVDMRSAL